MTYCVAIRPDAGLVFLADSRTNAGVDQISTFRKLTLFERPGDRVMVLMTAGNLSLSQAVRTLLTEEVGESEGLWGARNMHEAAQCVGNAVRAVYHREGVALREHDVGFNVSLIFGGQIGTEPCRLFQIYSAGNFIEATDENLYFQIGEAKYGKPILDRVIERDTTLDDAAKCALVSMDSTLRSNISVGLPLDLLVYEANSLKVTHFACIDEHNRYYQRLSRAWGERLRQVFSEAPNLRWSSASSDPRVPGAHLRAPVRVAPSGRPAEAMSAQSLAESSPNTPPE